MKPNESRIVMIIFMATLLLASKSLNIFLQQPTTEKTSPQKCFYTTVYRQQRLLIELEAPVLKAGLELIVEVGLRRTSETEEKKIVFKESIKEMKYKKTVDKDLYNIHEISPETSLEYETCIYLFSKSKVSTTPSTDFQTSLTSFIFGEQQTKLNSESYLISIKLLKNFSHILDDKRDQTSVKPSTHPYTKEHLEILQQRSSKLLAIARQQVKFHRENQKIQMKTEEHVKALEDSIYSMSLLQSGLLVCGSLTHINLMRSYLRGSGLL